jgi:hypothetical protein
LDRVVAVEYLRVHDLTACYPDIFK